MGKVAVLELISCLDNQAGMARGIMSIRDMIKRYRLDKERDTRFSILDTRKSQNRASRNEHRAPRLGQSIAEYTVLISVIAAALLAMQLYMKRGIQATIKYSTDQFGSQDWRETDADKVTEQQSNMLSLSEANTRIQQEAKNGETQVTTTMDENSTNSGVTTYQKEDEL
ncbi:MAG: hypothetical protein PHY46_05755 [Candidatus Omnitrophica bacterium]|nr:hypothetical protein [Candidatus Omnitrophota bacterium]